MFRLERAFRGGYASPSGFLVEGGHEYHGRCQRLRDVSFMILSPFSEGVICSPSCGDSS